MGWSSLACETVHATVNQLEYFKGINHRFNYIILMILDNL